MNNDYDKKANISGTQAFKTQKTITEFTSETNRMCPSCWSTHVISKGKQPKTGEMRAECKSCGKQFATLFSENLARLFAEKEQLKDELCKKASAEIATAYAKDKPGNEGTRAETVEQVLRGNDPKNAKKLQLLYFSNIKRNRISKIKQVIVDNTSIPRAQLVNLDFMDDNTLEIFCWQDKCESIISELAKLQLPPLSPSIEGNDEAYESFKTRMKNIATRRDNTKIALKRYALKLSNMAKDCLKTELTIITKKSTVMAGNDSSISIEIDSYDS